MIINHFFHGLADTNGQSYWVEIIWVFSVFYPGEKLQEDALKSGNVFGLGKELSVISFSEPSPELIY